MKHPSRSEHLRAAGPLDSQQERSYELQHQGELVFTGDSENPTVEKFLRLKTKLSHGQLAALKTILITSPVPGDGKSTISMNLALAFATNIETPTILIDCDLRRPSIHTFMRPTPSLGLAGVLRGETNFTNALCRIEGTNLHLLPTVSRMPDPLETLASSRFTHLLSMIKESYARIIIDTPPIVPFSDADALGSQVDGVIIVTRAGVTPKHLYQRAIESLQSAPLLGTVLNGSQPNLIDRGHKDVGYYYDYYRKKR